MSAIFCTISAAFVIATSRFDKRRAKGVLGLLFTNVALNISEALAYYFRGNVSNAGVVITRVSNFAVFFCNNLLLFFIVDYLCYIVQKNGGGKNTRLKWFAFSIVGVSTVLLILSRIFGFYYAFDEGNNYYRLDSYPLLIGLSLLGTAVLVVLTVKNWRYLRKVERVIFIIFEFLPIAALVLQFFVYGISVTTIANTVSILLVFIAYELEYTNYVVEKERNMIRQMISAFSRAIDEKDYQTGGHSGRVAEYSKMIAEKMGLDPDRVEKVYSMALLHDIGKIGIREEILNKPSKLTEKEYETIKTHSVRGSAILQKVTEFPELASGARWHHERYDGSGYPDGISKNKIPLEVRIISMADSYDAMTSDRYYRDSLDQANVRAEIENNIGKQFDPEVAKVMLKLIDEDTGFTLRDKIE